MDRDRTDGTQEIRYERRRSPIVAHGTLACPECDAPVAPPADGLRPSDHAACPYCGHADRASAFLTLGTPTRPAHVTVRVVGTRLNIR